MCARNPSTQAGGQALLTAPDGEFPNRQRPGLAEKPLSEKLTVVASCLWLAKTDDETGLWFWLLDEGGPVPIITEKNPCKDDLRKAIQNQLSFSDILDIENTEADKVELKITVDEYGDDYLSAHL